jgi:hypothetical protein
VKEAIEMKRVAFLCSFLLICSLVAGNVGQTEVYLANGVALGQAVTGKTCPFSITGTWMVEGGTTRAKNFLYEFDQNGLIIISERTDIIERTDDNPTDYLIPRDYEVIGGGKYALDRPEAPKRIDFRGISMDKRGAIPRGKSSLQVVEYGDDSFVTSDPKTQAETRWVRAQTHRRFLTFAARSGPSPSPSAFAMWTTLDGRGTKIDALGLRTENRGGAAPVFGLIPEGLYHEFEFESGKDYDVMLRLELTDQEFEKSYKVFRSWAEFARIGKLPHADHYLNGMEFLKSVAWNFNQCDEKLKLPAASGVTAAQDLHKQAFEYIKELKKKNNKSLHVTDGMFPSDWRPTLFPNG